ncbi:GrpB family protein [Neobacillus notoginsengisoli]|uniref:GrpB family protein n=1 Tax=Neobacillus notoginsengisoli TaxID=1578198 RepID=A0A417YYJ2_9BACI|nr:GrpB family protein [Neobacillus notoginsengisoli]RHW42597.1 GrpB family protein [Neobacillus notoginsengisoli]
MDVRLSEFNEEWSAMYEEEALFLKAVFGDLILKLEHFGSTAVKGMVAKPVIDMMVIVLDIGKVDSFNEKMILYGYDAAGEWGIPGRRLFRKGGENRTHHIHFYEQGNLEIARHLIFRDHLRAHPEEAARYSSFKEQLAKQYHTTVQYSPAKKNFVSQMERRALEWHKGIKRN